MLHGYTVSVKDRCAQYIVGRIASGTSGAASGVLSVQALLYAVGLGQGAIPMAPALNLVNKKREREREKEKDEKEER